MLAGVRAWDCGFMFSGARYIALLHKYYPCLALLALLAAQLMTSWLRWYRRHRVMNDFVYFRNLALLQCMDARGGVSSKT